VINFFWNIFGGLGSLEGIPILVVCLIVTISWLLGFLLNGRHSKDHKPLWLVFLGVTKVAVGFIAVFLLFVGWRENHDVGDFVGTHAVLYVLFFILFSRLGRIFIPTTKIHWLLTSLIFVGANLGVQIYMWNISCKPFGMVYNKELTEQSLKNGSEFDYEILSLENKKDVNEACLLRIRVKGDSAYYQTNCQKEKFGYSYMFEEGWMRKADSMRTTSDSSQWILLGSEKTSVVKKLKEHIASYEREFFIKSDSQSETYIKVFMLDDFKNGHSKTLVFFNAECSRVNDALAIEKMALKLWPAGVANYHGCR